MDDSRIEISGFLKQLSHEIRTPMNTIVGSTELIAREDISACVRESIADIRQAADRLVTLTDDLIDIVRISNGELELRNEEYCFNDIMLDVRSLIEKRAEQKGIEYHIDVDTDIPYRMFGDCERITQMLEKLITNAFEFTHQGSVGFTAKCLPGSAGGVFLRFEITDTGSGVLSDDIVKVLSGRGAAFEDGMRGVEGAAIGVFLTRYLAGRMGGKLTAKAKQGEGSSFMLLIEQEAVGTTTIGDRNELEAEHDTSASLFTVSNGRVLIVEDNLINARIEQALMHKYKIDADIVDNGQGAVELIKKIDYDLIFMDYMMPDMDGAETTRAIRSLALSADGGESYFAGLPIVAFTANTAADSQDKLLAAGMNDFLTKPVNITELERVLRQWLPADKLVYTVESSEDGGIRVLDSLGLNTGAALANFNGDESEYRDILLTMCRSSDTKSKMLNYYLEQHDYKNYIIAMHGILGVAQVIGAESLASRCHELEKAARQGVREFLERETRRFGEDFDRLLSSVRSVIMTDDKESNKGAIDREDLMAMVDELKGYLAEYQINEVEELFYTMAQFSYPNPKVVELIHTAEEYMLNYSYNEVSATLDEIRRELNAEL